MERKLDPPNLLQENSQIAKKAKGDLDRIEAALTKALATLDQKISNCSKNLQGTQNSPESDLKGPKHHQNTQ